MSSHSKTPENDHEMQDDATATAADYPPTEESSVPEPLDSSADVTGEIPTEDYSDEVLDEDPGFDEVIIASNVDLIYTNPWDIELQSYYPTDEDESGEQGLGVTAMPLTVPELMGLFNMAGDALEELGALDEDGEPAWEDNMDGVEEDGEEEDSGRLNKLVKGSTQVAKSGGGAIRGQWDTVARNPKLEWSVFVKLLNHQWKGVPVGWVLLVVCIAIGIYGFIVT